MKIEKAFEGRNTPKIDQGYLKIYKNNFEEYRSEVRSFCELGVAHGASLVAWKKYFPNAKIIGIDNNPDACLDFSEFFQNLLGNKAKDVSVEIGDAMDKEFLKAVAAKHGGFDIVLDDCSHRGIQMQTSFEALWEHTRLMYVIEDLQTQFSGNIRYTKDGNFIEYMQTLVKERIFQSDIENKTVFTSNKKNIPHISSENYMVFMQKEDCKCLKI